MDFPRWLAKKRRTDPEFSIAALSRDSGVHERTIHRLKVGDRVCYETAVKLQPYLGRSVSIREMCG